MKKFFIAFNNDDLSVFKDINDRQKILVGFSDLEADDFFNLSTVEVDHSKLFLLVNELFEYNSSLANITFDCFKNNFYECTLLPLARIMTFIDNNVDPQYDEIIFARKIISNSTDGPSYYMAEHESHRTFFYERACSFQPPLELYLRSKSIHFNHLGKKISFNWVKNLIRDGVVFSALLLNSLSNLFIRNRRGYLNDDVKIKRSLILIRSRAQLDFIQELVIGANTDVTILVLPSSTSDKFLYKMCQNRFATESHVSVFCQYSGFIDIIKALLRTFSIYFKFYLSPSIKKSNATQDGFLFNRAFCEMSLISFSTSLYSKLLGDFLDSNVNSYDVVFTCEQKSPQAYIDSFIARMCGIKSVQLMTCDQADDLIPSPVPSDLFVVDTNRTENMFRESWTSVVDVEKIKYLGSIKSLQLQRVRQDVDKFIYDYCYFCHLTEVEQNLKVIEILEDHCSTYKKTFCLKLHPRDNNRWLAGLNLINGHLINNQNFNQEEFFSSFEIALSNPSSVVMDLLACSKKFIFINNLLTYQSLPNVYVDEFYSSVLTDLSLLSGSLKNGVDNNEFTNLRKRILGDSNVEVSLENITRYLGGV